MLLEEFAKLCEAKPELSALWRMLIKTAKETAVAELPVALQKYHGKVPSPDEEESARKMRERFDAAIQDIRKKCEQADLKMPELRASDLFIF
ncbi:MAG: hypothetical protein AAB539_02015 [Patescibacteria group bacterium]